MVPRGLHGTFRTFIGKFPEIDRTFIGEAPGKYRKIDELLMVFWAGEFREAHRSYLSDFKYFFKNNGFWGPGRQ